MTRLAPETHHGGVGDVYLFNGAALDPLVAAEVIGFHIINPPSVGVLGFASKC